MNARLSAAVALTLLTLLSGCDEGTNPAPTAGSLTITGPCTIADTDGKTLNIAVFSCPFTMPPSYTGTGTVANGIASGTVTDLAEGSWCAMAYVDMVAGDGISNVVGVDPLASDASGTVLQATIVKGEETVVNVTYSIPTN